MKIQFQIADVVIQVELSESVYYNRKFKAKNKSDASLIGLNVNHCLFSILVILWSLYLYTKFNILSLPNIMNRFMLEQRENLLEIYFQSNGNWLENCKNML